MINDNDAATAGTMTSLPDAHGQAALVLVESLLHGLLSQTVLTLSEAVEIIESAVAVQTDIADAADTGAETMWRSLSLLTAMSASLKRDMDDSDDRPACS